MKNKLLFVIDSLIIGGAEKSLLSLLNKIDPSMYEIDLLLFKRGEELEKYLPEYVNILPILKYFQFTHNGGFPVDKIVTFPFFRIKTTVSLKLNNFKKRPIHSEQVVFKSIKNIMEPAQIKYDVAIAYSQGMPTYYVAKKVHALKKLAWINTDYVNTQYDKEFDFESYREMDKIITVSQHTKESVSQIREEYNSKVELILDIVDPTIINKMAQEHPDVEFSNSFVNIVTVGRLVTAKSFDMAIEVARLLKKSGYRFKWYGIGEGPERKKLQALIDKYKLNDDFILLGKKLNPYPYMKNCDLYVQTSVKEGFGLTVIEAKILNKPIVCTNFPTAKEIINHNVDGLIVEQEINSIYSGIKKYLDDVSFKQGIINELRSIEPYSSVNQLNRFYQLVQI
jgi:glycosyltransferase involved in cell wall biosynthesis